MKKRMVWWLVVAFVIQMVLPFSAGAAGSDFTPNPQNDYARQFITKCEGQQWFINEIERLLNNEQKTLDTITSAADFSNVKAIGLNDAGISGTIPSAIGELTQLEYLFLGGNQLSGTIPAELYSLPKLQNIDLSGNGYTGAIPSGFGTMPSLTTLVLKNNAFTGTIPDSILNNGNIEVLNLLGNQLTGGIPSGISGMTGLTYLNLSENALGGTIPDLSALSQLITLSLWRCELTGEISSGIYTLTNLQILDLAENGLTGEISTDIGNLTAMQYLTLDNNKLEGNIPGTLSNLTALQKLNLANNKLRGTIPDVFGAASLEEIHLESNYLRGTVPATLAAKEAAGAAVYLMDNYLTGDVLRDMVNNGQNFSDGATSEQYQLTASKTLVQVYQDKTIDLYALLQNKSLTTGNVLQKVLLNPDEYTLTYDATKLAVTVDGSGIHVMALSEIPRSENLTMVITILDNTGSAYSTVTITLTTDTVAVSSGGGGSSSKSSGNTEEAAEEPEAVTHDPYIGGYPDGTFGPNLNVSREEIAKMLIVALELEESISAVSSYSDVATDRWSFPYVEAATERGYLNGYGGGIFQPAASMTRAELATCLVRIAEKSGKEAVEADLSFSDVSGDKWYAESVLKAAELGLVNGYANGTFQPENTVSRAEAVTMINRMLERDPETAAALQTMTCPFSDVAANHWAYLQILEASLQHEH